MPAGIILAAELNRTLVLPRVVLDGSLPADGHHSSGSSSNRGKASGTVEFKCASACLPACLPVALLSCCPRPLGACSAAAGCLP